MPSVPPWLDVALVGLATLLVLWQLRPGLIFANTTPTGSDLGGHVWGPAQLRDHLLPGLSGWTTEWFGGLAAYVFYMPIPALAVVGLSTVLHYGVALKLVVAACALLLPVAVWALARWSDLPRLVAACLPVAVLGFVFDDSWWRFGGNLRSDLTGEFGYGLGLVFTLLALGALDAVMRTNRHRGRAALLAALAMLCHPVTGIAFLVAAAFLVIARTALTNRSAFARAAPMIVLGLMLAAFWLLPFFWYRGELNNLNHVRDTAWATLFFPLPLWAEFAVMGLAVVGTIAGFRRRQPIVIALAGLAVVMAFGVLLLPVGVLENGRLLPFWHLCRWLLAGVGGAEVIALLADPHRSAAVVGTLVGFAVVAFCIGVNTGSLPLSRVRNVAEGGGLVSKTRWLFLPRVETNIDSLWLHEGFAGYERDPSWPEYRALMATLTDIGKRFGCGRALTESDPGGRYGSPYEFALMPYWTHGCIASMDGVPEDMSRTFPFVELAQAEVSGTPGAGAQTAVPGGLNVAAAVPLLRELGVQYYLAFSPAAVQQASAARGLVPVAASGPWRIYEVSGTTLVQGLDQPPTVTPAPTANDWLQVAAPWFVGRAGVRPTSGGPPDWPRSGNGPTQQPVAITRLKVGRDRVSFHVERTGQPVEVRFSYFPWWKASGAAGPWRLAPNYLVIVPTGPDVTLVAQAGVVDHVGRALSLAGIALLVGVVVMERRRRAPNHRAPDTDVVNAPVNADRAKGAVPVR
jgi:hypothetical protein